MQPTVLLLQARHADDPARGEEIRSFARAAGLAVERIVPHDLLERAPSLAEVRRHDALMIGGSGEYYVSKEHLPSAAALFELLTEVAEVGHPTFASCFGFQCMVRALGGEIVHDPAATEVGTLELSLTDEGKSDPLFGALPERFRAQLGRKDRASRLPAGIPNLASSRLCPHQALRIPGRPVWASQFHPELDGATNRSRFLRYLDGYAAHMSDEEREAALARFHDSPETGTLLSRFLDLVLG